MNKKLNVLWDTELENIKNELRRMNDNTVEDYGDDLLGAINELELIRTVIIFKLDNLIREFKQDREMLTQHIPNADGVTNG